MRENKSRFLVGLGIGAVMGILFAPQKGSETRRRLREKIEDIKYALDDFCDKNWDKYLDIKDDIDPVISDLKTKAKPYIKSLQDGLEGKPTKTKGR